MILVDTSVLIDFIRNVDNIATNKLNEIIALNIPFGITCHVYQELLQGVSTQREFSLLKEYLDTLNFYDMLYGAESYAAAAAIYFSCRKKGITVRSSIDCLIVQIALEHKLKLLHNDRDFDNIKKIIATLDFY
jgi:predicted nucleic acid-binding protein